MIDVNAALRAHLVADSGVTTLVSTRVYAWPAPASATLPMVVFDVRGGRADPNSSPIGDEPVILRPSFTIRCFAATPLAAHAVYRAVASAMFGIRNTTVGTYKLYSAQQEMEGQLGVGIEDEWPVVLTAFQVAMQNN